MSADAVAASLGRDGVEPALAARLAAFGALLLERNASVNLTAARDAESIAGHILDSLTVAPLVEGPLVDVGSGGGFPAIPLALATGVEIVLVESTLKKARFLEEALAVLGLAGRVIADRAEVAAHDRGLRARFRTATARAVASAPTVLELTLPFLAPGGRAVLQRGVMEPAERIAATDAALVLGGALVEERELTDATGGPTQRRLVIVEQRTPSAQRFPRRAGIPAKRPLCVPEASGAGAR